MDIVDKMRKRIFDIIDPTVDYTQEDFDKEFGEVNYTSNNDSNFKLNINFVNESTNPNPEYATEGSSGFDLRASLQNPIEIPSGGIQIISTGLYFEIPNGLEIQVRPRSGLAAKNGVTVLNSPGTVDSDYRGEVKIILINHGKEVFTVNHGDRIAQAVIASVMGNNIIQLNKISKISNDTARAANGFGHTGIK
jgi:dUTP pyrophosphatase